MSDNKNKLPPPKSGGKPKKIGEGMDNPGGPQTPGAKAKRRDNIARRIKAQIKTKGTPSNADMKRLRDAINKK